MPQSGPPEFLQRSIRRASPGGFVAVAATGALSLAANGAGAAALSELFAAIATLMYVVLFLRLAMRAVASGRALAAELSGPSGLFGAFAFVIADGVLAVQALTAGDPAHALVFVALGAIVWLVLMTIALRRPRRLGGPAGWLAAAVATEALAVMGSLIGAAGAVPLDAGLDVAIALWLGGLGLVVAGLASAWFARRTPAPGLAPSLAPALAITATNLSVAAALGWATGGAPWVQAYQARVASYALVVGDLGGAGLAALAIVWLRRAWLALGRWHAGESGGGQFGVVQFGVGESGTVDSGTGGAPQGWAAVFAFATFGVAVADLAELTTLAGGSTLSRFTHVWVWIPLALWCGAVGYQVIARFSRRSARDPAPPLFSRT